MKTELQWQLSHLSVHDGSTVYSAEIEEANGLLGAESYKRTIEGDFWSVEWSIDEVDWPVPEVSSNVTCQHKLMSRKVLQG